MTGNEDKRQLDLTESITEVPQASNIGLFIALLEALRGEERTLAALASMLDVDERTVRYYVDFGRWLQWIRPTTDNSVALSTEGIVFVESVPARGRLFASALFDRALIKTVQRLKREQFSDLDEPLATRKACQRAVAGMTTLAEATSKRRASSLASMLRWAYQPRDLDWSTGRAVEKSPTPFDFRGQSFLTAYAARQFGGPKTIYIGFPQQVITFANGRGANLQQSRWVRASYDTDDGSARWFGSIPINPSTLAVARRGGPDLRRLLISCNPYLAILTTLMTSVAVAHPPPVSLTRDMYGVRMWYRDRELGPPLQALASLAGDIDLVAVDSIPHLTGRHVRDDLDPADDIALADLLEHTGIARPNETSLVLAPGVGSELRLPAGDGPTMWERMEPLRKALQKVILRRSSH